MRIKPTSLRPALAALCLALGPGLWASDTGETLERVGAATDAATPTVQAETKDQETKETKAEAKQERNRQLTALAKAPSLRAGADDPIGLYQAEGFAQTDPIEWILGMRADRTPADKVLRALEALPETKEASEDAAWAQCQAWGGTPTQTDAAPGFGANVYYRSPLIKHIQADVDAGRFTPGAQPWFLDAGAGVGYNTEFLAGMGARVVANDQSASQLAILRRRLRNQTDLLPRIHLSDGDIRAKSFPGRTFDGILASHLFHYLRPRELQDLVAQFHQWLKPGGRLYIQCWNIEAGIFFPFKPIWDANVKAGRPWPGSIENAQAHAEKRMEGWLLENFRVACGDYVHPIHLGDLVKLLETSGFTIIASAENGHPGFEFGHRFIDEGCEVMVVAQVAALAAGTDGTGDTQGTGAAAATETKSRNN